jgi:hypothetical protein
VITKQKGALKKILLRKCGEVIPGDNIYFHLINDPNEDPEIARKKF